MAQRSQIGIPCVGKYRGRRVLERGSNRGRSGDEILRHNLAGNREQRVRRSRAYADGAVLNATETVGLGVDRQQWITANRSAVTLRDAAGHAGINRKVDPGDHARVRVEAQIAELEIADGSHASADVEFKRAIPDIQAAGEGRSGARIRGVEISRQSEVAQIGRTIHGQIGPRRTGANTEIALEVGHVLIWVEPEFGRRSRITADSHDIRVDVVAGIVDRFVSHGRCGRGPRAGRNR